MLEVAVEVWYGSGRSHASLLQQRRIEAVVLVLAQALVLELGLGLECFASMLQALEPTGLE